MKNKKTEPDKPQKPHWVFCNTDLEPYPFEYSSDYRCPKCGNNLVNVLGTCATKKLIT